MSYWLNALDLAQSPGEIQRCQNVFSLQIFIVSEDLFVGHSGTEQLQNRLYRISKPANRGLAVANLRVNSYSVSQIHESPLVEFYPMTALDQSSLNSLRQSVFSANSGWSFLSSTHVSSTR